MNDSVNPYVKRIFDILGDREPLTVLVETPKRTEELFESFGEADLERSYEPGKWNAGEIIAHLADVELGLGFRFRQAVAEENYTPQSFDQDKWATRYERLEPSLAVETFRALRAWNLALFTTFELIDWNKQVNYPFAGVDTIDAMVHFLAGHDLNHLEQLETIARLSKN